MVPEASKELITVKEARKVLGKKYADHTDEQIEALIAETTHLAAVALKRVAREYGELL
jgi:hypothetical protein